MAQRGRPKKELPAFFRPREAKHKPNPGGSAERLLSAGVAAWTSDVLNREVAADQEREHKGKLWPIRSSRAVFCSTATKRIGSMNSHVEMRLSCGHVQGVIEPYRESCVRKIGYVVHCRECFARRLAGIFSWRQS